MPYRYSGGFSATPAVRSAHIVRGVLQLKLGVSLELFIKSDVYILPQPQARGGLVIIIGLIASIYVSRLAGTVKYLTDVVENINAGEAVPEIKVTSGDEIGALAEAIGRLRKP